MKIRGMLRGCWLLTDLDGTLLPTPHKAHGQYVKLSEGPCFASVSRWLKLGGNICVITTADRRVFEQVFLPLKSILPSALTIDACLNNNNNVMSLDVNEANSNKDVAKGSGGGAEAGNLLLSVFTGAVLYQATSDGVRDEPGYLKNCVHCDDTEPLSGPFHPQTSQLSPNVEQEEYVTCLSEARCTTMFEIMGDIFLSFARDVIFESSEAMDSLEHLSKRYRIMWSRLLNFLSAKYQRHVALTNGDVEVSIPAPSATPKSPSRSQQQQQRKRSIDDPLKPEGATLPPPPSAGGASKIVFPTSSTSDEKLWKFNYIRQHRELLRMVGIVRQEYVNNVPADYSVPTHSTNLPAADSAGPLLRSIDGNDAVSISSHEPAAVEIVKDFVSFTQELLGVENSSAAGSKKNPSANIHLRNAPRPVAQMIVVGMPMKDFHKYFGPYQQVFDSLGVSAIAQPNSVVFSRKGIDKSSTVRYLARPGPLSSLASRSRSQVGGAFGHLVNLRTSVALGDNPHTADHQLTVFPELRFVSVEKEEQRRKRHERIRASGGLSTESGPLMDDRLLPHLTHVGGEEEGTNAFLESLIETLIRGRNDASVNISEEAFQAAVTAAAAEAATRMHRTSSTSKL